MAKINVLMCISNAAVFPLHFLHFGVVGAENWRSWFVSRIRAKMKNLYWSRENVPRKMLIWTSNAEENLSNLLRQFDFGTLITEIGFYIEEKRFWNFARNIRAKKLKIESRLFEKMQQNLERPFLASGRSSLKVAPPFLSKKLAENWRILRVSKNQMRWANASGFATTHGVSL